MADPVITKATIFFQGHTEDLAASGQPVRSFGWTESLYYPGTPNAALGAIRGGGQGKLAVGGLGTLRAALLPRQCGIIAVRVQQVSPLPPGPAQTVEYLVAGGALETDMPQLSVLLRVPGIATTSIRRQIVRCIPDDMIKDGEYTPTNDYSKLMTRFIGGLGGFNFKSKDRGAAKTPVVTIDANGLVTCAVAHGLAIGDNVTVGRGRTLAFRNSFSGSFKVLTTPSATTCTVSPYSIPVVVNGGYIRKVSVVYPSIDATNTDVERSMVRKTGRPFAVFHGRQSKRHQ